MKTVPMTYYAPQSGVGLAMAAAPAMFGPAARIGFVGLGAGTLACYRQPGQTWTAFEIDPVIENIARKDFSYISRCAPDMKIAIGDARLTLANQPRGAFNLLAVDAFSSDAIPLHLVTREAFAVYGRTLADDGVLLIHISNRFLNLEPVIAAIAKDGGWQARARTYSPVGAQPRGQMFAQSTWIVLSRSTARLDQLPGQWRAVETDAALPVWRDDFASVLPVLRFRRDTH
ncbi:fused MFS/spermidine synthase, partial [Sandarakinorhabdus sp.]|uniref:spermidine synthase n=1 Tax=Sandarakinorhabdus sp. TaxID=1916663 RepID=UPI00286D9D3D